jgi:hypothetical protein
MGYRTTTEPVILPRSCRTCGQRIVGITERGLTTWLDVVPLTELMAGIYHRGGRTTWHVQPRRGRHASADWRNPDAIGGWPRRGVVLVEHPHPTPGARTKDPDWMPAALAVPAPSADPPF